MSRKIAVISDIHGNILALEKITADIKSRQIDLVYNLGDHLSGPLWPKETADFLKQQDWLHLLGNHDRNLISHKLDDLGPSDYYAGQRITSDDLEWLKTLPADAETNEGIYLCHGGPRNDLLYLLETIENKRVRLAAPHEIKERLADTDAPLLLCGHTHIPRIVQLDTGQLIVNPGSAGLPAYDDQKPEYHIIENGSPHARYAVLEKNGSSWDVEIIAVSYDHQTAAKKASENGRPDWEIGLNSGFMTSG